MPSDTEIGVAHEHKKKAIPGFLFDCLPASIDDSCLLDAQANE